MLRPRDRIEFGRNGAAGVAALPVFASAPGETQPTPSPSIAHSANRLTTIAARIETHCRRLDLAPNLAENIGSARWLRGVGTLLGLGVFALSFWPDFNAVEAATALPSNRATRDEFRSQMIMPLAMGGESGRHMGATTLAVPVANAPERAQVQLTATLGAADSFGRMLQRAGAGSADAARATQLVAAQVPLGDVSPGTQFAVTLGKRAFPGEPRPLDRLVFRARFDLDLALARNGGAMTLAARPIPVDATPLRIRGTVGSSLYRSARAAGAPVRAIQQYLQTLDGHLSLEGDIAPSDQFDFVVAYKRAASGEAEAGQLLFAGLERKGKPLTQLVRWGDANDSGGQFYEASDAGRPVTAATSLGAPVAGRITSGFGMRFHPVLRYARMHSGVDFGAAWGAPDIRGERWSGILCRPARRAWQLCPARSRWRPCQRLCAHEPVCRRLRHAGASGAGHWLCRFDRPVDRPASALRGLSRRAHGQSAFGEIRHAHRPGRYQAAGGVQIAAGLAEGDPAGRGAEETRARECKAGAQELVNRRVIRPIQAR